MTDDRDTEITHEATSFVAELRRLADALESGEAFSIHVDGEDVTIPEGARLSVAHERDGDEIELEFQISWTLDAEDDDSEDEEEGDEEEQSAESEAV